MIQEKKQRYINPRTDFGLWRIFGIEDGRELWVEFLNQFLEPENQISKLIWFLHGTLPKFSKTEDELCSEFEKWCFFLKNLEKLEEIPQALQEPIFIKAFEAAEMERLSPEEHERYLRSLQNSWEIKSCVETAIEDGRRAGAIEKAKSLIPHGLPDQLISEMTGLPVETIKDLRLDD